MSGFLTVEDVNGANLKYVNEFYTLDTRDIGTGEFSNVKYDFVIVSHSINGDSHTFTLEIHNDLWRGGYVAPPGFTCRYDSSTNTISVTSQYSYVKLYLVLRNYLDSFEFREVQFVPMEPVIYLSLNETNTTKEIIIKDPNGAILEVPCRVNVGINRYWHPNICPSPVYFLGLLKKTDLVFNLNTHLTVGKINKVRLNVDSHYLPDGDLVWDDELNISIKYEDTVIEAYFDETVNDYCFDLDLTSKKDTNTIFLGVGVSENDYVNQGWFEFKLDCQYLQVGNFSDLINEITVNGAEIIELSDDITLLSRIPINHDLIIYGKDYGFGLNGYGFNLIEGNIFKGENIVFDNGDTSIIQGLNTKVELTNCIFYNCESSNYNNLGSVVYCDVDIESLTDGNDFITTLTNCEFYDNHNCIFSGGELNILDCKLYNTDPTFLESNNPALVYQTDGTCTITGSVFDLDYTANTLCNEKINIGFAQTLIRCGQSAIINGVLGSNLAKDDILPFFEGIFNNRSHIFAKYYYPQIEECVYTSPIPNMEDRNICYAVSGLDWVFKENSQVTRASQNTQNENRKIIWED